MLDLAALKQIIEESMDMEITDLNPDASLYEELMDSIGAVAMVVGIQRRCRVRIADEDIPKLHTPNQIIYYVNDLIHQKGL
jgi:acyl carrier protein